MCKRYVRKRESSGLAALRKRHKFDPTKGFAGLPFKLID
jgi:hypothetical protein